MSNRVPPAAYRLPRVVEIHEPGHNLSRHPWLHYPRRTGTPLRYRLIGYFVLTVATVALGLLVYDGINVQRSGELPQSIHWAIYYFVGVALWFAMCMMAGRYLRIRRRHLRN